MRDKKGNGHIYRLFVKQFWPGNLHRVVYVVRGSISHDKITRMLSQGGYGSKDLWHEVKALVREHESSEACLIFDDTIVSKPYTDESELICWHWDHSKGCNQKGINLLTTFYHTQSSESSEALRIPVAFEYVRKMVYYNDEKSGKQKRKSAVTKNEIMRSMIEQGVKNQRLKFRYVLAGSWFSSSDNMLSIDKLKKYFVMDMKSNRKCMFATQNRNKGEMYLVSNDSQLSADDLRTLYKKRWSVEEYYKSLKQNTSLAKSPTRTVATQTAHLFASLVAYVKLERLKFVHNLNHFALKAKVYLSAIKMAWIQLRIMKNYSVV